MEESILKDLVAGNLYQWVDTNQVFKLLEFERAGRARGSGRRALVSARGRRVVFVGGREDKFTHVERWKIMIDDKIESWWLWKGSYRALECTSSSTEI